jgi:FAD/FMN-containing dehydrogenase/Fe-S oxidoreductase
MTIDAATVGLLEKQLKEALEGEVHFDPASRAIYSSDASVYQVIPTGVVIPKSPEDVATTLRICREHTVPLTARGGGTSQCGQSIGEGVALDFSKYMRRVLELDVVNRTVVVEPGMVLAELNAHLAPHGLQLPLDLSTANRATIGGMISNNSSGTRSIVYGSTIDYVMELKVLLADGSVMTAGPTSADEARKRAEEESREGQCYRAVTGLAETHEQEIQDRYPKIRRRVGGYNLDHFLPGRDTVDLTKIFVGSEGTLGLLLEAKLKLVELPGAKVLGVAMFPELRDALEALPHILELEPSAVELMDRNLLEMTRGKTEFEPLRDFIVGDPGAILIVEFMGDSAEDLPPRVDRLEATLREHGSLLHLHRALEPAGQARIWRLRQAGLGLSMAETGDTKSHSFVEDTAVDPDQLPDYIDRFQEILARHQTTAIIYAHASVGLLHIRPAVNMKTVDGMGAFKAISREVAELVLEFGGALSAEHGDGLSRGPYQEQMFGPVIYQAFCDLKDAFDPEGMLNPNRIVRTPSLTENLRFGTDYLTNEVPTTFDFSDFGGLSRATEQCGGVGACRKTVVGTMCPSFQATRDESASTRGRAFALRLFISGQMGMEGFTDPALYPVLDLCFECKACKTECPTGVDMARIKSEFLHQYQKKNGASLRSRLLGNAGSTAVWGSRFASLANAVMNARPMRHLNEIFLGLDERRTLPPFARETFLDWWMNRSPGTHGTEPTLALFADTFTNYFEPRHGKAAVGLAEKLGAGITMAPRVCCGRPLISKGFLDKARKQAQASAAALFPLAQKGLPIVFCEPGCFSAVKDDHPLLLQGEDREKAEEVARHCVTVEEWAEGALSASGQEPPEFADTPGRILVHGHCHQKALGGMGALKALLGRVPECEVVDAEAGCCGMAGSFGYEKEHYEVSKAAGDQRLFPAIRRETEETVVVAPGFSCRQQISHFTSTQPKSAVELMDSLIRE